MTDGEVAEHRYKLGRVLWELGGPSREDPTQAQAQFETASMEECDSQVGAGFNFHKHTMLKSMRELLGMESVVCKMGSDHAMDKACSTWRDCSQA